MFSAGRLGVVKERTNGTTSLDGELSCHVTLQGITRPLARWPVRSSQLGLSGNLQLNGNMTRWRVNQG